MAGSPRRIWRVFRSELLKSSRQPVLLVYLLLVIAVTVLWGPLRYDAAKSQESEALSRGAVTHRIEGEDPIEEEEAPEAGDRGANGFLVLAASSRAGVTLAAILLLLHAATLLAGEGTMGTYRLVLVRPVTRTDLLLGKALLLVFLVLCFLLVILLVAGTAGLLVGGYGDYVDVRFGQVDYTAAHLADTAVRVLALTPLALLAAAAFGLLCSAVFQSASASLLLATLAGIAALAADLALPPDQSLLIFVTHVDRYLAVLQSYAGGLSDRPVDGRLLAPGILVPAVSTLAFLLAARMILNRKEIYA